MRLITKIPLLLVIIFSLIVSSSCAKRNAVVVKESHPNRNVVVVRKKHQLFGRMVAYHPYWSPRVSFNHRWIYFPRYNFYWDNLRNVYVIKTGTVWVASKAKPKEVKGVNLTSEKKVELSEACDSQDSIQDKNAEHQTAYKVD